jgi:hypothetical protein
VPIWTGGSNINFLNAVWTISVNGSKAPPTVFSGALSQTPSVPVPSDGKVRTYSLTLTVYGTASPSISAQIVYPSQIDQWQGAYNPMW